jgi:cell division septal protein FtsQ
MDRNSLTVPLAGAKKRLLSFNEVRDVTFTRRPFHRLDCSLVKREPVALLASRDMLEIDAEGVVIPRRAGNGDIDLPIVTGIPSSELGKPHGKGSVRKAVEVLKVLKELGFSPAEQLSEIHVEGDEIELVWIGTGTLIKLGREEYAGKIRKLKTVYGVFNEAGRFPELIDLRFDRQVVIR